jgi:uncharacterized membrane protein
MSSYTVLVFLHVSAAIVWLGAAVTIQLLAIRADRSGDPGELQKIAADSEWLATRLFIPASLLVLAFGIALVVDGPWSFDQFWIVLGLAGYAFSFLVGILYLSPESGRIERLVAEHGGGHPAVIAATRRIFLVSRIELGVLFVVVLDMAVKPTADSAGFWVTALVGIGLVGALAVRSYAAPRAAAVQSE